jgi:phage portal protein BeeE
LIGGIFKLPGAAVSANVRSCLVRGAAEIADMIGMPWPFTRTRPAPTEAKSLAAPDAELLAILGALTTSGYAAGLALALTVPAVQRAIALIAGSIAAFPPIVERRADGGWTADDEHPSRCCSRPARMTGRALSS